jgi:hypothetical protein
MQDFHLKASTEHDLYQALLDADLVEFNEEALRYMPKNIALDVIGIIYKPTGNTISTQEGYPMPEMVAVDGFHANLRGSLTEEQIAVLPIIDAPKTPHQVWA